MNKHRDAIRQMLHELNQISVPYQPCTENSVQEPGQECNDHIQSNVQGDHAACIRNQCMQLASIQQRDSREVLSTLPVWIMVAPKNKARYTATDTPIADKDPATPKLAMAPADMCLLPNTLNMLKGSNRVTTGRE